MDDTSPNILFIVCDALRADALEDAPTISSIADNNLYVQNAIPASTWSLPSHVSLLDGSYPNEHGVIRPDHTPSSLALPTELEDQGYFTHCVSGNPFVSQSTGMNEYFSRADYTITRKFSKGRDLAGCYSEIQNAISDLSNYNIGSSLREMSDLIRDVATSPNRRYSLLNLLCGGIQEYTSRTDTVLNRIPHPIFNSYGQFGFSPRLNTELLDRTISKCSKRDQPFFAFANYMNTHRPYYPAQKYQECVLEDGVSYREANDLNKTVGHPWRFHEWEQTSTDESELELIRDLYRAEVRSVDSEISAIISNLEQAGVRENTIVVITADHGEALGEKDPRGWRSMGHVATIIDELLTVPLIICHPNIDGQRISGPISLIQIAPVLSQRRDALLKSDDAAGPLIESSPVGCCIPPRGTEDLFDRHSYVPEDRATADVNLTSVVGYFDEWKFVKSTDGTELSWKGDEQVSSDDIPAKLYRWVIDKLYSLKSDGLDSDSSAVEKRLEDLGYI